MSTRKIELSVGAVKYVDPNEMITEEDFDYIKNKIPELDGRVGVIEDEIDEINSSLDKKASKSEVNSKADKTYVDEQVSFKPSINDSTDIGNSTSVWSSAKTKAMISSIPKGDKGEPGTASISIDDNVTNTTQTWTSQKIVDFNMNYKGVLTSSDNLNNIIKVGNYLIAGDVPINSPAGLSVAILSVYGDGRFITQELFDFNNKLQYVRNFKAVVNEKPSFTLVANIDDTSSSINKTWSASKINGELSKKLTNTPKGIGLSMLDDLWNYRGADTVTDFNLMKLNGVYLNTSKPLNSPDDLSPISIVIVSGSIGFISQQIFEVNGDKSRIFMRTCRPNNSIYNPWICVNDENKINSLIDTKLSQFSGGVMKGKKGVVFGDSIMEHGIIPETISKITGATIIDCSFGGTRMARHTDANYNAFCMNKLIDAINTKTYTAQDTACVNLKNMEEPDDNTINLANVKTVDFSNIDFAVIAYGTNDFGGGTPIGDVNSAIDDTTFWGATRRAIEEIQSKHNNVELYIISPIIRKWRGETSDTMPNEYTNKYLYDYVEALREICKMYHIPFYDAYYTSGINKFTLNTILDSGGTHPTNPVGYTFYGEKISKFLLSN